MNQQQNLQQALWTDLATAAHLSLSAEQTALLARYLDLLLAANATMNLTRIVDREAAELLHVGDALTLLPYLPPGEIRIADVGSGGGAPALPLAIARPDARITCIEATGKKAKFLKETATALGLANVRIVGERAEIAGRGMHRQSFDVVTSRALGVMNWVAEYCLPLVKIGGKMLAMKGPKAAEELGAAAGVIRKLGGGSPVMHSVHLPGTSGHVIIEIPKLRATGHEHPRLPTEAKGKALR